MKQIATTTPIISLYKRSNSKAVLKTSESIHLVDIQDIIRCEADGNYTHFYIKDGQKITVSKTLKEFESLFNSQFFFFRIHNSHLINLNFMDRFDKKDGGMIVMKDRTVIPVSSRKRGELLMLLETI